ncbi:MAG: hypothetical protein R6V85_06285 [Polyangia bacterium]
MKKRSAIAGLAAVVMLAAPLAAAARVVYLNGVDISHVKSRTFKDVECHIDENGDIHLSAPHYKVEMADEKDDEKKSSTDRSEAGANPELRTKYFLATKPSPQGRAQYDVVVEINGVERKVIEAGDGAVITEISAWLKKGKNTVVLEAKKNLEGGRKSTSSQDELTVLIGAGHEEDNVVKMDVVHLKFEVDASQIAPQEKRTSFNAI